MTTQRQRARNAAIAAAGRESDTATSIDGAEDSAPPIDAPAASQIGIGASGSALHAPVDRSDVRLATVTPSTDRFRGQPPKVPPATHARQIGASRFRSKWGPLR